MRPLRIFFSCNGVGIIDRGIEIFFREAFDGLRGTEDLDITFYKGAGEEKSDEHVLWNVPRTHRMARLLGACIRRSSYVAEQLSTFPSMVRAIRRHRPEIIFYSDSNLGFQLFRWRKQIGVPFRLLFSNGGPCHPPFDRTDYVHQVAPLYYEEATAAGESPDRHRMVPYGINVPDGPPDRDENTRRELRRKLGLPGDRPIILSVGWISAKQKRMDYLVNEMVRLREGYGVAGGTSQIDDGESAPYLVLLGAMDQKSDAIIALARRKLGEENFTARSVSHDQVHDYYRAAVLFTLASLQEGFGRVFLEALVHGLPVIAHNHPVMRFVLGSEGTFGDLSKPGVLAALIREKLGREDSEENATRRREMVRTRFSWVVLAPQYREMFLDCFQKSDPHHHRPGYSAAEHIKKELQPLTVRQRD
jgi:1,2-diacylglycerol 3-alpha-glucosyltransferase